MVKYVDDINTAIQVIPNGHKWTKDDKDRWILRWTEEQMEIDSREGKSKFTTDHGTSERGGKYTSSWTQADPGYT